MSEVLKMFVFLKFLEMYCWIGEDIMSYGGRVTLNARVVKVEREKKCV